MLVKRTALSAPFIHRRTIRFGETDAAAIVYTARFFEYALDAIDVPPALAIAIAPVNVISTAPSAQYE